MPRTKTKPRKRESVRDRVTAEPHVLARFTDAQLRTMERKASRELPPQEQRELAAAAQAATDRAQNSQAMVKALKAARIRMRISQEQLDKLTGIGRANISASNTSTSPTPPSTRWCGTRRR